MLDQGFPSSNFLDRQAAADLRTEFAGLGISGGAVYDALVGAAAREHGLPLVSRDRRALGVYEALRVKVQLVI